MNTVKIYGSSDDIIIMECVEGSIPTDEFEGGDKPKFLHFNDGTVVRAYYDNGGRWNIALAEASVSASEVVEHHIAPVSDHKDYTDILTIRGAFTHVACWNSADGPTLDDLEYWMEDIANSEDVTEKQLRAMYAAWAANQ